MNSINTLEHRLATAMSDRAFRVFCVLVLRTNGTWRDIPAIAAEMSMRPHEIRHALSELCAVGLAQKERRYERGSTGRPTWHTYVRLADDNTAGATLEDVA
ncbi:hypothetical protein ACIBCC_29665 [Streptomyces griseus]|uniref:hypothetical protein n=1 Tax=Streptomyces griseus TaxID=1911 RepID=UPI00379D720F